MLIQNQARLKPISFGLPYIKYQEPLIHIVTGSSGHKYEVNLNDFSCTCPDWEQRRFQFDVRDIRRACKHVARFLNFIPFSWVLPIPPYDFACASTEIDGYVYALIQKETDSWVDVFVKNRLDEIYDYGFNVAEKRWSFKSRPRHAREIRELILVWAMRTA